jgi:hypothetical protein
MMSIFYNISGKTNYPLITDMAGIHDDFDQVVAMVEKFKTGVREKGERHG